MVCLGDGRLSTLSGRRRCQKQTLPSDRKGGSLAPSASVAARPTSLQRFRFRQEETQDHGEAGDILRALEAMACEERSSAW
jgi:hypothetical protein